MNLTINEVAKCLNLPLSTLERWIRQGRIPIYKNDKGCVFKKSALEKWAVTHNLSFSFPKEGVERQSNSEMENLLPAIKRGGILYDVMGDDVKTALRSAVENIPFLPEDKKDELYETLIERENLTSTGIGKGIAIPHPRAPLSNVIENSAIITCFLEKPVNFGAVDDKPVFVMFILLSTSTKIHLHLLSRLAFCMRDNSFVEFLKTSPCAEAFFAKIADFEKQLDKAKT